MRARPLVLLGILVPLAAPVACGSRGIAPRSTGLALTVTPTGVRAERGGLPFALEAASLKLRGRGELSLSCFGRDGRCDAPTVKGVRVEGARVEIDRGALREWYENRLEGIEQGFALEALPQGEGDLRLEFALRDLSAVGEGGAVRLLRDGAPSVRVDGLYAVDARGRRLPASMRGRGPRLEMRVDVRDAVAPVVIDPLYAVDETPLAPVDARLYGDNFGSSVAIDGDTAVVGTMGADASGTLLDTGVAYVFVRSGSTWSQQAKLSEPLAGSAMYGVSVSLDKDTIVVGAYQPTGVGQAFVYARTGATWTKQATLVGSDTATGEGFASRVSVRGDRAIVGAPWANVGGQAVGAAYVFDRSGTTWTQSAKLLAPYNGANSAFGSAVAIDGDAALVGAPGSGSSALADGAAYFYKRTAAGWGVGIGAGYPSDTHDTVKALGCSVAMSGATAIVGAWSTRDATNTSVGIAWVYVPAAIGWKSQARLAANDGAADDYFGTVALRGDVAVVAAAWADPGKLNNAGAAYVFQRSGTTWTQQMKLVASDAEGNGEFGRALGVSADSVIVGAWRARPGGVYDGGKAYVIPIAERKAPAASCTRNDECLSGSCADGVCCDVPCAGACEACTAAAKGSGADGTCGPVAADADPRDRCAPGTGVCAADGLCDGAGHCRSWAKSGTPCGATTCTDGVTIGMACTGDSASCAASTTRCSPYVCGADTCKTSCTTSADCADKMTCVAGACEAAARTCTDDLSAVVEIDGSKTPCGATRCRSGACVEVCSASEDCAPGYLCASGTCQATSSGTAEAGGCSTGAARPSAWVMLLLAALGLCRRCRSRPGPTRILAAMGDGYGSVVPKRKAESR